MDLLKQSIQKEIEDLKSQSEKTKKEVEQLKQVTAFHERELRISKKRSGTLRKTQSGAEGSIINAIIVAAIGGIIAIVFTAFNPVWIHLRKLFLTAS